MSKVKEVPLGVESRPLDSKSRLLTTTPWNLSLTGYFSLLDCCDL